MRLFPYWIGLIFFLGACSLPVSPSTANSPFNCYVLTGCLDNMFLASRSLSRYEKETAISTLDGSGVDDPGRSPLRPPEIVGLHAVRRLGAPEKIGSLIPDLSGSPADATHTAEGVVSVLDKGREYELRVRAHRGVEYSAYSNVVVIRLVMDDSETAPSEPTTPLVLIGASFPR